jgi:acetyltransferase EpsM
MLANKEIIVIGAGGHASELYSYIQDIIAQGESLRCVGLVDDYKPRGAWGKTEILGNFESLKEFLEDHADFIYHYITAVGSNQIRRQLVQKIENLGKKNLVPWILRHPHSNVGLDVEIGEGSCLAPGTTLTTRLKIGQHCILNVNVAVHHDCRIGNFTNLNPGAVVCGNVKIGDGCYIGAGATIIDKISIGEWTIIGAGAVVVRDIPAHVTAVGIPARVIRQHSPNV